MRKQRGVSLVEIMVALAILALAFVAIFQFAPHGFAASTRGKHMVVAAQLGQMILERVRDREERQRDALSRLDTTTSGSETFASSGFISCSSFIQSHNALEGTGWSGIPSLDAAFADYYCRVRVFVVVDKARKYWESFDKEPTPTERDTDRHQLARITVTVRGPVASAARAASYDSGNSEYVRVANITLATYVANKSLVQTTVVQPSGAITCNAGTAHSVAQDKINTSGAFHLLVDNTTPSQSANALTLLCLGRLHDDSISQYDELRTNEPPNSPGLDNLYLSPSSGLAETTKVVYVTRTGNNALLHLAGNLVYNYNSTATYEVRQRLRVWRY